MLGLYEHHVKPAIDRAESAESSLAAMRQRAERAERAEDAWERSKALAALSPQRGGQKGEE